MDSRWRPLGLAPLVCALLGVLVGPRGAAADDEISHRRERVSQMTPAEKEQLQRRREQFLSLPSGDREKLRDLATAIDSDPNGAALRDTLARYRQWLKSLSPAEQLSLEGLSPAERIERIRQIQQEQKKEEATIAGEATPRRALTPSDLKTIATWIDGHVWSRREQVLAVVSPEQRNRINKMPEKQQRRAILEAAWVQSRKGAIKLFPPAEFKKLVEQLSPAAQDEFRAAQQKKTVRALMMDWTRMTMADRIGRSPAGGRGPGPFMQRELERFLREELSAEEQERFSQMPPERKWRQLHRLYIERTPKAAENAADDPPAADAPAASGDSPAAANVGGERATSGS